MRRHLSKDVITAHVLGRLYSRIQTASVDDCWEWTGAKNRAGYGRMRVPDPATGRTRGEYTHRLSFIAASEVDIPAGMVVMHTCDNPPCCNPHHLRLGTLIENNLDRDRKGRTRGGGKPLRPATKTRGKVEYIGVWVDSGERIKRFRAQVNKTYLGHFLTAEEAARAADAERKRVYGDEAILNFPDTSD